MRLASFTAANRSSYGIVVGDGVVDVGALLRDRFPTLKDVLQADALAILRAAGEGHRPELALADLTLQPPITAPGKIVGIGRNFRGHAAEMGSPLPAFPVIFIRVAESLLGADADIQIPPMSDRLDFEGELAVVIGKGGMHIPVEAAIEHVAGYSCFNDASLRDVQFEHSLAAGKNFVATGGFGPWLCTRDAIPDVGRLELTTRLNGDVVQHSHMDDLIFDVPHLIAYISAVMPLSPGDVIATGTPEGVGFARTPPLWMKAGDVVEVDIPGIGLLRNGVKAFHP